MTQARILIVDDDPKIRTLLSRCLEGSGFATVEASDMATTLKALKETAPDLITLDLVLGPDDGVEVARQIRAQSSVPIIMVTGKDDVIDCVVGLELGADDYITKPFHVREVVARVKSVLRRAKLQSGETAPHARSSSASHTRISEPSEVLCVDGLQVTPDRFELIGRDGNAINMTSGDFRLLQVFLENPRRALSRDRLMDLLGGGTWAPLDRTIDNQISRLRHKIERNPTHPKLITTIRGVGYAFTGDISRP